MGNENCCVCKGKQEKGKLRSVCADCFNDVVKDCNEQKARAEDYVAQYLHYLDLAGKEKKRADSSFLAGAVVACDVVAAYDEPSMLMEVVKSIGAGMEEELLKNGNPKTRELYKFEKGCE